jgi:thioredoxin-related protein
LVINIKQKIMRINIITVLLLLPFSCALAQEGIQFDNGSWKEVLAKAKKDNRLVFVDVYTSWCGPCKKMVKEVFPQKEVGDVFNASFVNYKIDAEKGEGIQVAKSFGVRAYPTYLFVNGDGELVYRVSGYNEPQQFLQQAAVALKEKNDPKPFEKWLAEYESGKRDKDFLMAYLKKRMILKIPSAELIEEIFPLLSKEELNSKELMSTLFSYDASVQYVPGGYLYEHVSGNGKAIDSLFGKSANSSLRLLQFGMRNYFSKNIIANAREEMLTVMLGASENLYKLLDEKDAAINLKRIKMDYYAGTHDEEKLVPAVLDYVNEGLLKMDVAGMIAADKADFEKFMQPFRNGTADSLKTEDWEMKKRMYSSKRMVSYTYCLRDAAENIYHNTTDKKLLLLAEGWAKAANDYFNHFSTGAVYASLKFKTGNPQLAVQLMQQASEDSFLKSQPAIRKVLLDNANKMKQKQAPVKIWQK